MSVFIVRDINTRFSSASCEHKQFVENTGKVHLETNLMFVTMDDNALRSATCWMILVTD